MTATDEQLVEAAAKLAQAAMADLDGSHDFQHVVRVCRTAVRIAKAEQAPDLLAVQVAALLHDVGDWKYFTDGDARLEQALNKLASMGLREETAHTVRAIIKGIGFKEELKQAADGCSTNSSMSIELACCQDADRLDAIGAIGIARCFTFGGSR
jgi:uncharacterized protein